MDSKANSVQRGFMLIEALIAVVIFSFGLLAIIGLQAVSIKNASEAKYRTEASFLANELIGRIWADRSSVVSGYTAPSDWTSRVATALPSGSGTITIAANPNVKLDAEFVITVTVKWTSPGGQQHQFVSVAQINGAGPMTKS